MINTDQLVVRVLIIDQTIWIEISQTDPRSKCDRFVDRFFVIETFSDRSHFFEPIETHTKIYSISWLSSISQRERIIARFT